MLGKLSVLKECFFYKLGTHLVKAYAQKKNWLFLKVEFFLHIPILDLILDAVCI